jgi:hypothetical protein
MTAIDLRRYTTFICNVCGHNLGTYRDLEWWEPEMCGKCRQTNFNRRRATFDEVWKTEKRTTSAVMRPPMKKRHDWRREAYLWKREVNRLEKIIWPNGA